MIAVEGLRNYKMDADADRISVKFLSTIMDDYKRVGTILEKYNMVTRSSDVTVAAGYQYNADGFGWTNGVFLVLLEKLSK
jgi:alpha,alpha-trehalase